MAAANLLALLDDIATVLDDVAVLTKLSAQKTAGVLGDDLALNAQQVAGVRADRELPVVWAVAKGSFLNKAILVPAALAISAFVPWLVTPLLMVGGMYLCYEGFEKVAHLLGPQPADAAAHHAELTRALSDPATNLATLEKEKIAGAIRTDFVLSAEIITITLGAVADAAFPTRLTVMVAIAVAMTIGVYGLVAAIVKLDDAGAWLNRVRGATFGARAARRAGAAILRMAPWLMRALSIGGTIAMFLVGGGILAHGWAPLHHWVERLSERIAAAAPAAGELLTASTPFAANTVIGLLAGAVAFVAAAVGGRALAAVRG